jgi:hypothetical protein
VLPHERQRVIAAADRILAQGGWCVLERCVEVPVQCWVARGIIFDLVADAVADSVEL